MGKHKCKCKKCGDVFEPTKEEIKLFEDGDMRLPDICDECFKMMNEVDPYSYSDTFDSDSGL